MSDYSELKRLAEQVGTSRLSSPDFGRLLVKWTKYVTPNVILDLIAENERLDRESQNLSDQLGACDRERRQFKADNEALRKQIDDMSPLKGAPLTGPELKCLACGGYHYGMSGLPCPKMAPMARAAMNNGEQANG